MQIRSASGLYDGFEEFRTRTGQEIRQDLASGLVVFDTNTLLNLYRYATQTRQDFLSIMMHLRDNVWMPNQVASEFWRNREAALNDPQHQTTNLISNLEKAQRDAGNQIRQWCNRSALSEGRRSELLESLESGMKNLFDLIQEIVSSEISSFVVDTNEDSILSNLETIYAGKVGKPFTEEQYRVEVDEARRRSEEKVPPGYIDAQKKEEPYGWGDYLLWREVVLKAKEIKRNVVIITGDDKEDWWLKREGKSVAPRRELRRELLREARVELHLLSPSYLLAQAGPLLGVRVGPNSVKDATRVEKIWARGEEDSPRYLLDQLPEGRSANYVELIAEMASLAKHEPNYGEFIEAFQRRFTTITRKDVARRRVRVLEALGLASGLVGSDDDGLVRLTALGEEFVGKPDVAILQSSILDRIQGARDLMDLTNSLGVAQAWKLIQSDNLPVSISSTQAEVQLRWLRVLGLINE